MAVIAVPCDDLVTVLLHRLHADGDGFLADVKVTKAADQPHAVKLACTLFEAADEQHVAVPGEKLVLVRRILAMRRTMGRPMG